MPKRATASERRHMARVRDMNCLVCGFFAEVHHVHSDGMKRIGKSHRRVIPLCHEHHRTGPNAVHAIGHARFQELFGFDPLAKADELWEKSNA